MPTRAVVFRPLGRNREQSQQSMRRDTDRQRGTTAQRGYGADWQRLRLAFLAQHPLCECDDCGAGTKRVRAAQVVDHIIPISERPDLRLAETNLRAMAKSCHDARTARDQGFGRGRTSKRPSEPQG